MKFSSDFFSKDYFYNKIRSNYGKYDLWNNDWFWKPEIKIIKKYKIKGKALDIGCAFGFFLKRVAPYFEKLYGIDISNFALERAKKEIPEANLRLIDLNTDDLPFPDKYFDLITAFDVLEHTESIENSLKKLVKKLNDNGYIIITLPVKDTWAGKIFHLKDKDLSHISVTTRKEIFETIDRAGLKIIEKEYFFNAIYLKLKYVPVDIRIVLKKIV